jgi:hypothetical protein
MQRPAIEAAVLLSTISNHPDREAPRRGWWPRGAGMSLGGAIVQFAREVTEFGSRTGGSHDVR